MNRRETVAIARAAGIEFERFTNSECRRLGVPDETYFDADGVSVEAIQKLIKLVEAKQKQANKERGSA